MEVLNTIFIEGNAIAISTEGDAPRSLYRKGKINIRNQKIFQHTVAKSCDQLENEQNLHEELFTLKRNLAKHSKCDHIFMALDVANLVTLNLVEY